MSDKNKNRSKTKRELQKFHEAVMQLGHESIGDFIELAGGTVSMLMKSQEEKDDVKRDDIMFLCEQFVQQTGFIIDKIGHLDHVIARNEGLKKAAKEAQERADKISEAENTPSLITPPKSAPGTILGPDGAPLK